MRLLGILLAAGLVALGCAKPCDINADGKANDLDYAEFQSVFGTSEGDPGFNRRADFDGDGIITGSDFSLYLEECKED